MLELVFQPSDVGGKSSSFFVEYQDCGNGFAPACSDVELAMDDPSRVLVMSVGGDGAMQLKRGWFTLAAVLGCVILVLVKRSVISAEQGVEGLHHEQAARDGERGGALAQQ